MGYNHHMIEDTFRKIQSQLDQSAELSSEHRSELNELIASLSQEVQTLSKSRPEDSNSISGYAQLSAQEATRDAKRPELLEHSLNGMKASIAGLEAEHPRITALVNRFTSLLSNMGI